MRRLEDERLKRKQLVRRRERVRVGPVRAGVGCDVSESSRFSETSMKSVGSKARESLDSLDTLGMASAQPRRPASILS